MWVRLSRTMRRLVRTAAPDRQDRTNPQAETQEPRTIVSSADVASSMKRSASAASPVAIAIAAR
jgi:hypothetical protein